MANDFFNASGYPSTRAAGASAALRTELANVALGFDKFPAMTGNGLKLLRFNAGATAVEAVSSIALTSISLAVGSAAAPSWSFTGNSGNGWWSPGTDIQAWSTGGVESLRINAARNVTIAAPSSGYALDAAGGSRIVAGTASAVYRGGLRLEGNGVNPSEVSSALEFSGSNVNAAIWSSRLVGTGGTLILATQAITGGTPVERLQISAYGKTVCTGGMATNTSSQAFTATPTFDCNLSNVFEFSGVMTANVTTTTITNASNGQTILIRVKQDATGSRTFATPAGAKISGAVQSTLGTASILTLTWSAIDARWEGFWTGLPV